MPMAWALYSDMNAMVFGDTSKSVDEVISPRFFYCSPSELWTESYYIYQ